MNKKTYITHPFIVICMLRYNGKSVIYVQDTKRHPTVILTFICLGCLLHILAKFSSILYFKFKSSIHKMWII